MNSMKYLKCGLGAVLLLCSPGAFVTDSQATISRKGDDLDMEHISQLPIAQSAIARLKTDPPGRPTQSLASVGVPADSLLMKSRIAPFLFIAENILRLGDLFLNAVINDPTKKYAAARNAFTSMTNFVTSADYEYIATNWALMQRLIEQKLSEEHFATVVDLPRVGGLAKAFAVTDVEKAGYDFLAPFRNYTFNYLCTNARPETRDAVIRYLSAVQDDGTNSFFIGSDGMVHIAVWRLGLVNNDIKILPDGGLLICHKISIGSHESAVNQIDCVNPGTLLYDLLMHPEWLNKGTFTVVNGQLMQLSPQHGGGNQPQIGQPAAVVPQPQQGGCNQPQIGQPLVDVPQPQQDGGNQPQIGQPAAGVPPPPPDDGN